MENQIIIETLSAFGGQLNAMHEALLGVLRIAGSNTELRQSVIQELERGYTTHLGQSTNEHFLAAYENTMNVYLLALKEHQGG